MALEISPTIEGEFIRRGMFHELRRHNAVRMAGAASVHHVSTARATEVMLDAQAMREKPQELLRGIPKAYTALARNVAEALRVEARRDLWDAPGIDEMKRRLNESPARFEEGQLCLYFQDDGEPYGTSVKIVGGLNLYRVSYDDGHFIHEQGRCEFQMGYVVQEQGQRPYFARPYQLTRDDCKPSHLRLVVSLDAQQASS